MLIGKLVIEIHPIGIVARLLGLQLHLGMAAGVCGKLALIGCVFALAAVHRDAHLHQPVALGQVKGNGGAAEQLRHPVYRQRHLGAQDHLRIRRGHL